ncbi:TPA: hypothetical protein IAA87_08505 [Candidatus Avigastranaerophilus faecigallinarum]|nr:hypothetical protein [Candidatus Avigastranaerophilus faecigallinarum]
MNMNCIGGVYSYNVKPNTVAASISSNPVKFYEGKDNKTSSPDDMINAINAQGAVNKPFVTTTNELTFGENGAIVADRRKMTIQNGKVQFGNPVSVELPTGNALSVDEAKEKYINTMLSNSSNILNCVFLVKDSDGSDIQVSISADKKDPYKIMVSTRKDMNGKFEDDTVNSFNSTIGSSDDAIKTVIQSELEKYGIENMKQIAISNQD